MADYLRNSPFNRCVYNVILRHGPKPLPLDMLTLFNEAYYQCVRINYDPTPGTDLSARYVQEETLWLTSNQSANLIFNIAFINNNLIYKTINNTFANFFCEVELISNT